MLPPSVETKTSVFSWLDPEKAERISSSTAVEAIDVAAPLPSAASRWAITAIWRSERPGEGDDQVAQRDVLVVERALEGLLGDLGRGDLLEARRDELRQALAGVGPRPGLGELGCEVGCERRRRLGVEGVRRQLGFERLWDLLQGEHGDDQRQRRREQRGSPDA